MTDDQIYRFTARLHSFIEKWTEMMLESVSNSLSGILEFFFTSDFTFHIVSFINIEIYIYIYFCT